MEQKKERNSEKQEVVLRIYSRLSGWLSFDDDSGDITLSSYSLTGYQNEIEQALKEDFACQDETGLAPYLDDFQLKKKVLSMKPGVERWKDELWGVLTIKSNESLSDWEIMRLKSEWRGQLTDGWGEGFVQREIPCDDESCFYVDFCAGKVNAELYTEQELKGSAYQQSSIEHPKNFPFPMAGMTLE